MIREACVETFEEAMDAMKRGAERIELCADLANDGLTPSVELTQKTCSSLNIPVMVMIRPRAGNFVYSPEEISLMKQEIDMAREAGAAGVVFGLLTTDGQIDEKNTQVLADYAKPLQVTFHKAIDLLHDPEEGVRILKKTGNVDRILSSGGKATAMEGMDMLKKMITEAGTSVQIIVAGKVTNKNLQELAELTGAEEFHGRRIMGDLDTV